MTDFELAPKQKLATRLLARQRHTCLVGGSRSMKTFTLVRAIAHRACKYPHSRHGIFRFRGNAARSSISLDTLPKVFRLCYPNVPIVEHRQDGYFELPTNKSQIWVGGLDDKERTEKILGNEYATVLLNECSQIPYGAVLIIQTRLAQVIKDCAQRAFYDLNPVGKGHWSNIMFGDKKEPRSRQPYPHPENYARMFMNPKDNPHLTADYLEELQNLPERQRKRFYDGEYIDEVDGALWTYEVIETHRIEKDALPEMKRITVNVDPSGAADQDNTGNDEIGITVTGIGVDNHGYVLEDCSVKEGPAKWGRRVVKAYHDWNADSVIAEKNFGGEMVRFVINTADKNVPVRLVNASHGKTVRAEPISSLYEKGLCHHVGRHPRLEDQMAAWATSGYTGEGSPDRADSMVWGFTHLLLKLDGGANLIEYYRRMNEAQRAAKDAGKPGIQAPCPAVPTMGEIMAQEAEERARAEQIESEAIAAAQAEEEARLQAALPKGKAGKSKKKGARAAAPIVVPPAPVLKKSSFSEAAQAQGKVGAPDPVRPIKIPPRIVVNDHTITQSFIQGAKP